MINNLIDFLNTTFININIKENFNDTTIEIINANELKQLEELTNIFNNVNYKYGYSFFVNKSDNKKYYQQLIDYELIPDSIYTNKIYKYKNLKITPTFKNEYKSEEQYELGDVVLFNKTYYINLVVPKDRKHKLITFTKYSMNIPPLKKFADYVVWKRINFNPKPVKI